MSEPEMTGHEPAPKKKTSKESLRFVIGWLFIGYSAWVVGSIRNDRHVDEHPAISLAWILPMYMAAGPFSLIGEMVSGSRRKP